eukprot:CAMPEP_0202690270 /NCGR_PEP_ID=MMETSP1385-20130828/5299_1 /ASSEMBLY_ACC=CAM_ASM_000861 /TAXON_ID=933848 /ORGANISM="Elphidium margaritaceum" /LENGTH=465 /DNA_ID=CAMNT_0049345507 /DNA_START=44 /DNA_END=1441 /DNA_ORIENTATION=-
MSGVVPSGQHVDNEQKITDACSDEINIVFEIEQCQFFVIKNDERREMASGKLRIISSNAIDGTEIVFTFPDFPRITHTLSSLQKRPSIKMCACDYIFLTDGDYSFGVYLVDVISITAAFEQLLSAFSYFRVSSKQVPLHHYPINDTLTMGPPDKIAVVGMQMAQLICKGSVASAKTIRKATVYGTKSINKSKRYLLQALTPNDSDTAISPSMQSALVTAQIGGKAVVKVSGAVLTGCIATANAISNEVADALSNTSIGQQLQNDPTPKMEAAKEVVKSTVAGVYTVYDELVHSGLHLVQHSSHATATVLGHKYGDEVHRAAESAADIVDSAANTFVNVNQLGYKALAKRIAANSTVDVLCDEEERKENRGDRLGMNAMHAVQGLMIANNMDQELQSNKMKDRQKKQMVVGLEAVEMSSDNYRMVEGHNDNEDAVSEQSFNSMQMHMHNHDHSDANKDADYILDVD